MRFEGTGSEIPIKYASQVNCESNLFDMAYLAFILRNESGWAVINQIEPRQRIVYHENHGWKCV